MSEYGWEKLGKFNVKSIISETQETDEIWLRGKLKTFVLFYFEELCRVEWESK